MKSAGKARNNGLYRHIRTSKEIIRNLLNDSFNNSKPCATKFTSATTSKRMRLRCRKSCGRPNLLHRKNETR